VAESIRLLIVDDDVRFLDTLEAMLAEVDEIEVVGRALNGDEAVQRASELMPDVITMDLEMPRLGGLEATRRISHFFKIPIVLLTGSHSADRAEEALAAGAVAHVVKSRAWGSLVPALRAAVGRSPRH
jgi:CheY-like chemotaxis protein